MQTLTFTNSKGSLNFGTTAPFFLQRIEGVSGLPANIITQKSPFQNGNTFLSSNYTVRNITMTIAIKTTDYTTLNIYKRQILNIMTANTLSTLTYSNETYTKEIECYVEVTPSFSQGDKTKDYQSFFVSLICNQPFWEDTTQSGETFSISLGNFSFDWEITEDYEIETEGINRTTITNAGDVETPVLITFEGPATNPKIINETTGKYIEVTKVLLAGEKLIINTEFGNKEVVFDDGITQTNAFGLIDLTSEFWQLQPGENTISYTSDFGIDTATVNIQYRNRYIGI